MNDLSGMKFGRLTVIKPNGKIRGHVAWLCKCDCGNETTVESSELLRKNRSGTKSCGCLSSELSSRRALQKHPEPFHKERLYHVWLSMNHRCYCNTSQHFKDYGGRGISVCDEWRHDYTAFRTWALSHGYVPEAPRGECTLDRIDVDGNYCPDNCRWVNMKTQVQNRRNSKCS